MAESRSQQKRQDEILNCQDDIIVMYQQLIGRVLRIEEQLLPANPSAIPAQDSVQTQPLRSPTDPAPESPLTTTHVRFVVARVLSEQQLMYDKILRAVIENYPEIDSDKFTLDNDVSKVKLVCADIGVSDSLFAENPSIW